MTGPAGGAHTKGAATPPPPAAGPEVQASLSIILKSQPRSTAAWPGATGPAPAVPGKAAAATGSAHSSSSGATADAAALPPAPHTLNVRLTGLQGLEQEVTAVAGHTEQVSEQQWRDVYTVPFPEQQLLSVDELLISNWATAAGQLQVHVTVSQPTDTATSSYGASYKKPNAPAPVKGAAAPAAPTVPPLAAGTLQLNCAGLLVGDTSATYSWQHTSNTDPARLFTAVENAADASVPAATEGDFFDAADKAPASSAAAVVPAKSITNKRQRLVTQPPSGNLNSWLGSAEMQLQLYKPLVPDPASAADPKAANAGAAAAGRQGSNPGAAGGARSSKAAADAALAAAVAAAVAPEPCSLLTAEQAALYNPVVVYAYKAAKLPDAPATQQQLDSQCEPVKLKTLRPPLITNVEQTAAVVGSWSHAGQLGSRSSSPVKASTASTTSSTISKDQNSGSPTHRAFAEPATRTVLFATPIVFLGSSAGSPQQLLQHCRSKPLVFQIHDRSAKPEPPEFPIPTAADDIAAGPGSSSSSMADEGEVYGIANVTMLDLARGGVGSSFAVPICPASTVRGAASLNWKRRPGNYMQANSVLKGWVRAAVPIHKMTTAADQAAAAAAVATNAPAGQGAAGRRVSTTGMAAAGAGTAAAAAAAPAAAAKPPPRVSAAQVKLLQQQQEQQQQELLAQQAAAAELQRQQEEQRKANMPPQPTAYVALPSDVRYPGAFTRAMFMFDYRDSDLFHALEDTVRQHNAMALKLAPPPPPTQEEIAAAEAAAAAAAAEAAAVAAAAAAAAASPLQSRLGTAASRAAAARGSTAAGAGGLGPKAAANRAAAAAAPGTARSSIAPAAAATTSAAAKRNSQIDSTPRSILRQSNAGGGAPSVQNAPTAAASTAAASSPRQQQPHHARFARASELGNSDSESDSDVSSEAELSEAELKLQAALRRYDHVIMDSRMLQGLSTTQLDAATAADPQLDLLTGFHLVDGTMRVIVLEGPATGIGMSATVPAIARWALEEQQDWQQQRQQQGDEDDPQASWLPRRVVHNPTIKYPDRLYAGLGVDLWMIKLREPLNQLGAQPGTFASGRVRPETIAGMERLLGLTYGYATPQNNSSTHSSNGSKSPQRSPTKTKPTAASPSKSGSPTPGSVTARSHASTGSGTARSVATAQIAAGSPKRAEASLGTSTAAATAAAAPGSPVASGAGGLARLIDEMRLFPTAVQMQLIDKKFGGELTKADVLGVEADEPDSSDSEDEQQQQQGQTKQPTKQPQELSASNAAAAAAKAASAKLMALLNDSADTDGVSAAPAAASGDGGSKSIKSGRSRRSRRSHAKSRKSHASSSSKKHKRNRRRARNALGMSNEVYLHLRLEAQRRRQQRDLAAEHEQYLHDLEVAKQGIREDWGTWNPQRAAAKQLEEAVATGTITLEDTIKARMEAKDAQDLIPGSLAPDDSIKRGWYPHEKPFLWPAPRDPATYNTHPLKPSDYRVQELDEAWQEGTLQGGLALGKSDNIEGSDFNTLVRGPPTGLFTQDPAYWQTVHLGGDCWEEQLAAQKAAEKAEWAAKVVVKDTAIHVTPGTGDKASAPADKYSNMLKGEPVKKGFKVAHVPPAPANMYAQQPWEGPTEPLMGTSGSSSNNADGMALGPTSVTKRITSADRSKWVGGKDFVAKGNKTRSAVAKPGFSDAATAAMHDPYYTEADE